MSVKCSVGVLRARIERASHAGRREKKKVSPQSRSPFSASFQTFCLTARAYLQKYGLFSSLLLTIYDLSYIICAQYEVCLFSIEGNFVKDSLWIKEKTVYRDFGIEKKIFLKSSFGSDKKKQKYASFVLTISQIKFWN